VGSIAEVPWDDVAVEEVGVWAKKDAAILDYARARSRFLATLGMERKKGNGKGSALIEGVHGEAA
jgi:hypothetical protein